MSNLKVMAVIAWLGVILPLNSFAVVTQEGDSPSPQTSEDKSSSTLRDFLHSFLPSTDNQNSAEPATMESEASDISGPEDLLTDDELQHAVPWRVPDFTAQNDSLGWSEKTFEIPKGLEGRVAFWHDIYTKYTSDEGLIHDRDNFDVIYAHVDFNAIMSDQSKNRFQKAKMRDKLVTQKRKEILERLKKLKDVTSPLALSGEDLRYWKLWESVKDTNRFKEAAKKNRIRFQLGQKDHFIVGIYHSGRYLTEMERIFREEKLPVELTRLPFVESSFNIRAHSKVGASGIWQFMRRTARPFLRTNLFIDERNDPLKATRASARLLKQNFSMLKSWPLAVTGYNHGPYGVKRIVKRLGTQNIAEIINTYSSRRFGFASENFYACFLAALDVERNAKKYLGEVKWGPPVEATEIRVRKPVMFKTVLDFFDGDVVMAELANPHVQSRVRKGRSPVPVGSYFRVPPSRSRLAEDLQSGRMTLQRLAFALKEVPAGPLPPMAQ